MSEEANVRDNVYQLNLTEWELDTINKVILGCQFPGTHVDLVQKLMEKINKEKQSWES